MQQQNSWPSGLAGTILGGPDHARRKPDLDHVSKRCSRSQKNPQKQQNMLNSLQTSHVSPIAQIRIWLDCIATIGTTKDNYALRACDLIRGKITYQFKEHHMDQIHPAAKIGLITVSDRAFQGVYEDQGIPSLHAWLESTLATPYQTITRLVPDEQAQIEEAIKQLVDDETCCLVLTTGGTGPAPRDVTPEATRAVADRVLDGFGEQMRAVSLKYVPTAILSRQLGVIRKQSLILNLPGQPKAIKETLDGVFAAIPYCIDLIGGPYIETNEAVVKAFRPKSAQRRPAA